jgi:hypothetical protein
MHQYKLDFCYTLYQNFTYNRLPENEPLVSKHVENIINQNISFEKAHFVCLNCINHVLQCTAQKKRKIHLPDYITATLNRGLNFYNSVCFIFTQVASVIITITIFG